jgi:hypothetical protein
MTVYKNILNDNFYIIYKNPDGTFTAFPNGKVDDEEKIIKNCKIEDFVIYKIISNKINGFM